MTHFNSKKICNSKNSIKLVLGLIFPLINAFGLVIANWKIGKLIKTAVRCWNGHDVPYGKKEIYSQCYIFLLHIKERGEILVLRSYKKFLNARLKLVLIYWNKKRHSLPVCDSSMKKFVRDTNRSTGVSLLSH